MVGARDLDGIRFARVSRFIHKARRGAGHGRDRLSHRLRNAARRRELFHAGRLPDRARHRHCHEAVRIETISGRSRRSAQSRHRRARAARPNPFIVGAGLAGGFALVEAEPECWSPSTPPPARWCRSSKAPTGPTRSRSPRCPRGWLAAGRSVRPGPAARREASKGARCRGMRKRSRTISCSSIVRPMRRRRPPEQVAAIQASRSASSRAGRLRGSLERDTLRLPGVRSGLPGDPSRNACVRSGRAARGDHLATHLAWTHQRPTGRTCGATRMVRMSRSPPSPGHADLPARAAARIRDDRL